MIPISDAVFQTQLFITIFVVALLIGLRLRKPLSFDNLVTEELKGFAMLAIIFSHIGYFLVTDHRFLFPISVAAGVGVNLFLFLSGFGLTITSIKKPLSVLQFYQKRLLKLFIPLWIILALFLIMDFFLLQKNYPIDYLIKSFLGFFPTSNPYYDVDSPLWYLTLILFYYLIFPLFFHPKKIIFSGIGIFALSFVLLKLPLPISDANIHLYNLHLLAFPLGVIVAGLRESWVNSVRNIFGQSWIRVTALIILVTAFGYFAIYSGVGEGQIKEQTVSLISTFLIVAVFLLKNFQFKFLNLIGKYSYEIYLIHWPILFEFDHLFKFLPPSFAVVLYLLEFVVLAVIIQKLSTKIGLKLIKS